MVIDTPTKLLSYLLKEDESNDQEEWHQYSKAPDHVAKERRHFYILIFTDRAHHEVWRITNVSVCPHENGTCGNGQQGR